MSARRGSLRRHSPSPTPPATAATARRRPPPEAAAGLDAVSGLEIQDAVLHVGREQGQVEEPGYARAGKPQLAHAGGLVHHGPALEGAVVPRATPGLPRRTRPALGTRDGSGQQTRARTIGSAGRPRAWPDRRPGRPPRGSRRMPRATLLDQPRPSSSAGAPGPGETDSFRQDPTRGSWESETEPIGELAPGKLDSNWTE